MNREIHDIYDAILKIIVLVYKTLFLNYVGIDEEIDEILNIEFTTLKGTKVYLDFLCSLENGKLFHIEFQYPKAKPEDNHRFFKYNIIAEVRYQQTTDTMIFNFTRKIKDMEPQDIGNVKSFHPHQFYLGDVDFEGYIKNIKIKVESNTQLTPFEEITLLLISLNPEFDDKFKILERISKLLKNKQLFDDSRFDFIQATIQLEIENLLTEEEQKEIDEDVKMTPRAMEVVTQAINEVNQKVLAETREESWAKGRAEGIAEGKAKGIAEGRAKGIAEGRAESAKEIAKDLRDTVDLEELSKATGLTIEEIKKL